MKRVIIGIFFLLLSINFVFAASEFVSEFSVDKPSGEAEDYVSSRGFFDFYGGYIIVSLVVLVFVYLYFISSSKRKTIKRRSSKRRVIKRKKK